MEVYICTKFHENIHEGNKVTEWTQFSKEKLQKGHNSVKNVDGSYGFFFFAHRLMVVYICTKLHENILDGVKVIE